MRGVALGLAVLVLSCGGVAEGAARYKVRDSVRQAQRLLQRHDYAGAVAACDELLRVHPDDPVALAVRGSSLAELGEYARAIADHDASLALAPDSPGALTNACWSRALGRVQLDRALAYCDQAVAAEPSPTAYDTRGFLRLRRGEYGLAVADYTAALNFRRQFASSFYGRGIAHLRLDEPLAGLKDLRTAIRIEPGITRTYARRGVRVE